MHITQILNIDEVVDACEARLTSLDNLGFCIKCGAEHDSCESDARKYTCYECGERAVYGAEECLMMMGG